MRRKKWTETDLRQAVQQSFSIRQVLLKLGLRPAGGNYEQIKKYIKEYNLENQHFRGKGWNAGMKGIGKPRIPLADILVKNSSFQSFKLKKRLFSTQLKPTHCELCGWAQYSVTGHLPLELDHINGDRHDNRIENLRILCPNCHSLTETYRSKKRTSQ
ncbi:HNH endonuclease [Patescibacteria group bacterium]|nr:HNH endonuclease [Patescibacteria group bacterium]